VGNTPPPTIPTGATTNGKVTVTPASLAVGSNNALHPVVLVIAVAGNSSGGNMSKRRPFLALAWANKLRSRVAEEVSPWTLAVASSGQSILKKADRCCQQQ